MVRDAMLAMLEQYMQLRAIQVCLQAQEMALTGEQGAVPLVWSVQL